VNLLLIKKEAKW